MRNWLILNKGLMTCELLDLINSDIDLEKRMIHVRRGIKLVQKREGFEGVALK